MINIDKYDFFIFDCDGVILESNELKSGAFATSLPHEPADMVNEFVTYHKENGGMSRYKKFDHYFRVIKKHSNPKAEIEKALDNFAAIVSEGLLKCNYIPGVVQFIKKLHQLNKQLFVVSGSDEKELNLVFIKRGIYHYFEKIYGSPADKLENTCKVVLYKNKSRKGIFFGDSKADYKAAKYYFINFIYIKGCSEWSDGFEIVGENNTINDFTNYLEKKILH